MQRRTGISCAVSWTPTSWLLICANARSSTSKTKTRCSTLACWSPKSTEQVFFSVFLCICHSIVDDAIWIRPRLVLLSKSYCRDINIHRCQWQKILNTVEYGNANSMLKTFTCKSHHQSVTRSPHLSRCFSSGVMWWWMDAFNPVSCRCSFSFPTTPSWTCESFFNFRMATGKMDDRDFAWAAC